MHTPSSRPRSSSRRNKPSRPPERSGVILLVMVIVLVLFSLVCVTWVISAKQNQEIATALASQDRYDTGYEDLLNQALLQVIRGSNNPYSVMGPHSLLEDKYGNDGLQVSGPASNLLEVNYFNASGGTLMEIIVNPAAGGLNVSPINSPAAAALSDLNDYYNGRLLTFIDCGDATLESKTVRIIDYTVDPFAANPSTAIRSFVVAAIPSIGPGSPDQPLIAANPFLFIINGREFNGQGFTFYDPTDANPDLSNKPVLYRPNQAAPTDLFAGGTNLAGIPLSYDGLAPGIAGYNAQGADEPYDAVDWNNMLLSARVWDTGDPNDPSDDRWRVLVPSMHRPALLNYMTSSGRLAWEDLPGYLFRPHTGLHPGFLDNNPDFDLGLMSLANLNNQPLTADPNILAYDVDNDGDGEVDSVWIDLGLPAQTAPDGRMYKPLFALLVEDMDSRLNVNHHGTQDMFRDQDNSILSFEDTHLALAPAPGLGEGPADVNLKGFLSAAWVDALTRRGWAFPADYPEDLGARMYNRLLYGDFATTPQLLEYGYQYEGRYGEMHRRPTPVLAEEFWPAPGLTNVHDPHSSIVNHDFRNWRRRFGVAPDLRASDRLGVSVDGQIRQSNIGGGVLTAAAPDYPYVDSPYEFNMSNSRKLPLNGDLDPGPGVRMGIGYVNEDHPFTAGELEALVRFGDTDMYTTFLGGDLLPSGLEDRLVALLGLKHPLNQNQVPLAQPMAAAPDADLNDAFQEAARRVQHSLTTHSADSSAPNIHYTPDMYDFAFARDGSDNLINPDFAALIEAAPSPSIVDLVRFRIAQLDPAGALVGNPGLLDQVVNTTINNPGFGYLIAPDLLAGTRMDLNRPFGNGRDDLLDPTGATVGPLAGNGVIDEGHNAYMGPTSPYQVAATANDVTSAGENLIDATSPLLVIQPVYDMLSELNELGAAGSYTQFVGATYNLYQQFYVDGAAYPATSWPMADVNYDGVPDQVQAAQGIQRAHLARHEYAKQLFSLLMMLKDPFFRFTDGGLGEPDDALASPLGVSEYTTYRLAQYSVNAVDFMDRDSIMTAFEYDANPFVNDGAGFDGNQDGDFMDPGVDNNGDGDFNDPGDVQPDIPPELLTWEVDGDITTVEVDAAGNPLPSRRVIWGMEAAAMQLTETLAFHDNRTIDVPAAQGGVDGIIDGQGRMPQGSLFIELLCTVNGVVPAELRPTPFAPWDDPLNDLPRIPENVIDLSRLAPAAAVDDGATPTNEAAPHPVWRMVVGERNSGLTGPPGVFPLDNPANPHGSLRPTIDPDPTVITTRGTSIVPFATLDPLQISRVVWLTSYEAYYAQSSGLRPEDVEPNVYYSDLRWAQQESTDPVDPTTAWSDLPADEIDYGNLLNWDWQNDEAVVREAELRMFHVAPQQYAVVGPRVTTKIGHSDPMQDDKQEETVIQLLDLNLGADALTNPRPVPPGAPGYISADFDGHGYVSPNWDPTIGDRTVRQPVGIVINGPRVDYLAGEGTGRSRGRGLSISEPPPSQDYYTQPNPNPGPTIDNFDDYNPPQLPPEDTDPDLLDTDVYPDWQDESLYLQRLANPLAPHHPVYNPYITLDAMQLDLSTFNGEEDVTHPLQDPPEIAISRQKTGELYANLYPGAPPTEDNQRSIWGYIASSNHSSGQAMVANPRDNRAMLHSLGHINGLYNGIPTFFAGLDSNGDMDFDDMGVGATPHDVVPNDHYLETVPDTVLTEAGTAARLAGLGGLAEHIALTLRAEFASLPLWPERSGDLQTDVLSPPAPPWQRVVYNEILALAIEQTLSTPTGPGSVLTGSPAGLTRAPLGGPTDEMSPSFAWGNRPFISPLELLNVPATSPERFLRDFSLRNFAISPYAPIQFDNEAPYRYLLDFFQDYGFSVDPTGNLARSNFYQLFEYVHVPSKFSDTQDVLNPDVFANIPSAASARGFPNPPLYPPFNRIPRFYEWGKINPNTIFDDGKIWAALLNDRLNVPPFYTYNGDVHFLKLREGRAGVNLNPGDNPANDFVFVFDPADTSLQYPSFFPRPFQGYSPSDDRRFVYSDRSGAYTPPGPGESSSALPNTLLRWDTINDGPVTEPPPGAAQPMMATRTNADADLELPGTAPNSAIGTVRSSRDGDRHAVMRHEALTKMGNIVTTRSNTFAVWITVGFFEVQPYDAANNPLPANYDARDVYPDGMMLGREIGLDSGQKVRHRMFAIIDRTRPTAFVRGLDLNAKETVLLQRVIE